MMKRLIDKIEIGQKFGYWTVLIKKEKEVVVMCKCGTQKSVRPSELLDGRSRRCKKCSKVDRAAYNFSKESREELPNDEEKNKQMIEEFLAKKESV